MDSNNNATDYSMQTYLSASIAGLYYLSSLNLMGSFIAVCTGDGWQVGGGRGVTSTSMPGASLPGADMWTGSSDTVCVVSRNLGEVLPTRYPPFHLPPPTHHPLVS